MNKKYRMSKYSHFIIQFFFSDIGRYAEKYGELNYQEREVDYGVKGYYFEKARV